MPEGRKTQMGSVNSAGTSSLQELGGLPITSGWKIYRQL
jgi:hypothetical protein